LDITAKAVEQAKSDPVDLRMLLLAIFCRIARIQLSPISGRFLVAGIQKNVISPAFAFSITPDPKYYEFYFEDSVRTLSKALTESYTGKIQSIIEEHHILVYTDDNLDLIN